MQYQQPYPAQHQQMPLPIVPSYSYIPVKPAFPQFQAPVPQYQPYVVAGVPPQQPVYQAPAYQAVQPVLPSLPPQYAPAMQMAQNPVPGAAPRLNPQSNIQYVSQDNNQPHFVQTDCRRLAQQRDGVVDCQHPYQVYMDRQKK